MRKIAKAIRSFFVRVNAIMRLRRKLRRTNRRLQRIERHQSHTTKELLEAISVLEIANDNAKAALSSAAENHIRDEEAMNELRAELEVAADITIPALVGSHTLIMARIEAETAANTRRTVAAQITESE